MLPRSAGDTIAQLYRQCLHGQLSQHNQLFHRHWIDLPSRQDQLVPLDLLNRVVILVLGD